MKGCVDECLKEAELAEQLSGGSNHFWTVYVHANRGMVYARQGDIDRAERELEILMETTGRQNCRIAASQILFALGRVDEAIDWCEAAADAHEPHVVCLRKAPQTPPEVWNHPRYQALLHRIGLG
jgi:hypothetical protein